MHILIMKGKNELKKLYNYYPWGYNTVKMKYNNINLNDRR